MQIETLTRMGRDIVRNNAALGHDEAVARVARHLRSFWTPAMIAEIESYAAANPAELDATLMAALEQLEGEAGE